MASKVDICNRALSRIKAKRITSLDENSNEARLCKSLYDNIAEEVMFDGEYSSTISRSTLNLTVNTPNHEYSYEYQLPTDPKCLRVLNINETVTGEYDHAIEGDKLLANISTMSIRFIGLIEDTESYDLGLKRVITAKLAYELAYPLTGSASLSQSLYNIYLQEREEALSADGQQGSGQTVVSPDIKEVR